MSIVFFDCNCKSSSKKNKFGICDIVKGRGDTSEKAFIDENNGENWIAIIDNFYQDKIDFYAIDNCVAFPLREDGKQQKRCDGLLISNNTIAFVELKSRNEDGAKWVYDAEKQLLISIGFFEKEKVSNSYDVKRAYIVNNMRPKSRISQAERMDRFLDKTGYVLFIKARIRLYSLEG